MADATRTCTVQCNVYRANMLPFLPSLPERVDATRRNSTCTRNVLVEYQK